MRKSLGKVGCPLCGAQLEVGTDKKGKPYTQCSACGMQIFIRGTQGIGLLDQRMKLYAAGGAIGAGETIPAPIGIQFERIQQLASLSGFAESIKSSKLSAEDKKLATGIIKAKQQEIREELGRA